LGAISAINRSQKRHSREYDITAILVNGSRIICENEPALPEPEKQALTGKVTEVITNAAVDSGAAEHKPHSDIIPNGFERVRYIGQGVVVARG
jgi:hypothetical protein